MADVSYRQDRAGLLGNGVGSSAVFWVRSTGVTTSSHRPTQYRVHTHWWSRRRAWSVSLISSHNSFGSTCIVHVLQHIAGCKTVTENRWHLSHCGLYCRVWHLLTLSSLISVLQSWAGSEYSGRSTTSVVTFPFSTVTKLYRCVTEAAELTDAASSNLAHDCPMHYRQCILALGS